MYAGHVLCREILSVIPKTVKEFEKQFLGAMLARSTILGLVPFLFDGPKEVFWFAFAIGTIAGMAFSILALIFYLPVFTLTRNLRICVLMKKRC